MDVQIGFTWDGLSSSSGAFSSRPAALYLANHHHHHHDHESSLAGPLKKHCMINGAPTMTMRTDPISVAPNREMDGSSPSSSQFSIPFSRILASPLIHEQTQRNFKTRDLTQNVSNPEIIQQDSDNTRQRNQVLRPPSLSLSISQSSRQRAVKYSIEVVLAPSSASRGKLPGVAQLYMGIIFAFLGVTVAFQKGRDYTLLNKKLCLQCEGYGVERCDLCRGWGQISWEGKLRRADPCPLCFGSCLKKCSHCGGIKVKKGAPPSFQPSPPKDFF